MLHAHALIFSIEMCSWRAVKAFEDSSRCQLTIQKLEPEGFLLCRTYLVRRWQSTAFRARTSPTSTWSWIGSLLTRRSDAHQAQSYYDHAASVICRSRVACAGNVLAALHTHCQIQCKLCLPLIVHANHLSMASHTHKLRCECSCASLAIRSFPCFGDSAAALLSAPLCWPLDCCGSASFGCLPGSERNSAAPALSCSSLMCTDCCREAL